MAGRVGLARGEPLGLLPGEGLGLVRVQENLAVRFLGNAPVDGKSGTFADGARAYLNVGKAGFDRANSDSIPGGRRARFVHAFFMPVNLFDVSR